MHVDHLLRLDSLDLALVWGDEALLGQEIGGVTATDLEDPTRFLQPGEIVLSGLVWWSPDDGPAKTDRFVSALRAAGAVALLAGEETHGEVPKALADACRTHRIALLAVPAHTSFRAITEAVYLRQWGELSRRPSDLYALPENVRGELRRELDGGATAGALLDSAFAHLGAPPCYLLTSSGRTVARTGGAADLPAQRASERLRGAHGTTLRIESDDTVFDAWHLHLPDEGQVPPRVLHEIAELLGRQRRRDDRRRSARGRAQQELVDLVDVPHGDVPQGDLSPGDVNGLEHALSSCGLADKGPYTVVIASSAPVEEGAGSRAALAEALNHLPSASFAVGERPCGRAIAVVAQDGDDGVRARLGEVWPLIHACRPDSALYAGVSEPVAAPAELPAAVGQARYALAAAARTAGPGSAHITAVGDLAGLRSLLAGVPADVRAVFRDTVLGPLLDEARSSNGMLLETLEVFLAHNCSWARTAEALHLHVNTVHYRVQRIESLTGRDLSRLDHKLDLRAALLCR
ncbi:helix-turn-helix domain-containing protein [Streptomyces sp. NPDC059875]|uniref:helix-turn-helix domain-containing protein n=1 Tax=unclassified Streptomyces TaxID=2593676 RepID=UPI0036546F68